MTFDFRRYPLIGRRRRASIFEVIRKGYKLLIERAGQSFMGPSSRLGIFFIVLGELEHRRSIDEARWI
jgi:hypothetical protein